MSEGLQILVRFFVGIGIGGGLVTIGVTLGVFFPVVIIGIILIVIWLLIAAFKEADSNFRGYDDLGE